MSRRRKTKRR